jgi:hypothetical protein
LTMFYGAELFLSTIVLQVWVMYVLIVILGTVKNRLKKEYSVIGSQRLRVNNILTGKNR